MNDTTTSAPKLNIYQRTAARNARLLASQIRPGEIWVGNTNVRGGLGLSPSIAGKMLTARLGEQAYDIEGEPIEPDYMRPCFIHESEMNLYNRLMMDTSR